METDLKMIKKWQKDTDLVVKEAKTEACLFGRRDSLALA